MRYSLLLMAALAWAAPVRAENRAVVIGNADYRNAPDLAGSDTAALVRAMRDAGFVTAEGIDQPTSEIRRTLDLMARRDDAAGARIVALNGRFLHRGDETWFMGADAAAPALAEVGTMGIPLSLIMQMMAGADPGAVLLLGTDQQDMPHHAGLDSGIGELVSVPGVSVIVGSPESAAAALRELGAGRPIARALAAARGLRLLPGGDVDLVPRAKDAQGIPSAPLEPVGADREAWVAAVEADSVEGYLDYLETYPSGLFASSAEARRLFLQERRSMALIERDAWTAATAEDRVPGYEGYLRQFPQGRQAEAATRRLSELKGRQGLSSSRAPSGIEAMLGLDLAARTKVQTGLYRLGYEPGLPDGILGARTRQALKVWQEVNGLEPTGYLTAAQHELLDRQIAYLDGEGGRRDREYWQRTGAGGEAMKLRHYLRRYPQGLHAEEARRKLSATGGTTAAKPGGEVATWRWARRQDSAAGYQSYLDRFPAGAHAVEATTRRDNLQAATEAARREEQALELSSSTRRRLETALSREGLDPGEIDGRFTDETREALRLYQASQNLGVTGYLSQQGVARLLERDGARN